MRAARPRTAGRRSSSPRTSSARSRRSATGSGSSATGRLVDQGTLAELRHLSAQTIEVTFDGPAPELPPLPGVHVAAAGPERAALRGRGQHRPADRRAGRASRRDADQPGALAGGDLPAPLRRRPRAMAARRWPARAGGATLPLTRRALRDARTRTIAFGYLFAVVLLHSAGRLPPRLPDARRPARVRPQLRRQQGAAPVLRRAVRPADGRRLHRLARRRDAGHRRRGFGLLAAVRALRAEEDAGRIELVLAGIVSRRTVYLAAMARSRPARCSCGRRSSPGSWSAGLPLGGSAYLALATVSVVAGVRRGRRAGEPARARPGGWRSSSERRGRAVSSLLRVIADTSGRRSPGCAGSRRWDGPRSYDRSPAHSRWCSSCRPSRARFCSWPRGGSRSGGTWAAACSRRTRARGPG